MEGCHCPVLLIHIPTIGDAHGDNVDTLENQGGPRSVCETSNYFRPECFVSSMSARYATWDILRDNTFEAVVEERYDNGKDADGLCMIHKSVKSAQACIVHSTNLAKPRYEARLRTQKQGSTNFMSTSSKSRFLTHSTTFLLVFVIVV